MYKIISNISIINQINEAAKIKENNPDTNYCEVVKHPIQDLYIIPIIPHILKAYNLAFITEAWLSSDLIENYPADWEWLFEDRLIRVKIPFRLQANAQITKAKKPKNPKEKAHKEYPIKDLEELGGLLDTMLPLIPNYMIVNGDDYITIYLEELYAEHRTILELFEEIIIEEK